MTNVVGIGTNLSTSELFALVEQRQAYCMEIQEQLGKWLREIRVIRLKALSEMHLGHWDLANQLKAEHTALCAKASEANNQMLQINNSADELIKELQRRIGTSAGE